MNDEKIYIAGSSNEVPLIRSFITAVTEYGYSVTLDWTQQDWTRQHTPEELEEKALLDERAVREADILWYVTPAQESGKSEGSHFELGVARGLGKIILVSGPPNQHQIFPRLPKLRFERHALALECLRLREWDTPETELLCKLITAESVTVPASHLGMQRAAKKLEMEGEVRVSSMGAAVIVTMPIRFSPKEDT
jgi:hypothetical protein